MFLPPISTNRLKTAILHQLLSICPWLYTDCPSLSSKIHGIRHAVFDTNLHIMALTETWPTSDDPDSEICISGCITNRKDDEGEHAEGAIVHHINFFPPATIIKTPSSTTAVCPLHPMVEILLRLVCRSPACNQSRGSDLMTLLSSLNSFTHSLNIDDFTHRELTGQGQLPLIMHSENLF